MELKQYPANRLKKDIAQICQRHLTSGHQVFFFGSRVQGTQSDRSDIDVGIMGKQPLSARAKLAIEDELDELPMLYKIDVVDFATVSPNFSKEARRHTENIISL